MVPSKRKANSDKHFPKSEIHVCVCVLALCAIHTVYVTVLFSTNAKSRSFEIEISPSLKQGQRVHCVFQKLHEFL